MNNTIPNEEDQRLKKNSSMKFFPKLNQIQPNQEERMTAPNRVNPLKNLYMPNNEKYFENSNVPQGAEIVFISKKDQQLYMLQRMDGRGRPARDVLVNVRDNSVKGLKKISSVRSINNPGQKKLKKKRKTKQGKFFIKNLFNIQANMQHSMHRRIESREIVQNRKPMTLPNKYTMPQNLINSTTEISDQVIFFFN